MHGEEIMSHALKPSGKENITVNPTCCTGKTIPGGIIKFSNLVIKKQIKFPHLNLT